MGKGKEKQNFRQTHTHPLTACSVTLKCLKQFLFFSFLMYIKEVFQARILLPSSGFFSAFVSASLLGPAEREGDENEILSAVCANENWEVGLMLCEESGQS